VDSGQTAGNPAAFRASTAQSRTRPARSTTCSASGTPKRIATTAPVPSRPLSQTPLEFTVPAGGAPSGVSIEWCELDVGVAGGHRWSLFWLGLMSRCNRLGLGAPCGPNRDGMEKGRGQPAGRAGGRASPWLSAPVGAERAVIQGAALTAGESHGEYGAVAGDAGHVDGNRAGTATEEVSLTKRRFSLLFTIATGSPPWPAAPSPCSSSAAPGRT
jgi:hypothetical protein